MPRETIHYGREYARVSVPETDGRGAYEYELEAHEAKAREAEGHVTFSTKPHLDLLWQRPSDIGQALGEEPNGSVQVSISLTPQDMQWRINRLQGHPEDLEDFSTFYTERLTRSQINHFIRTLKRARDAAYGSDE